MKQTTLTMNTKKTSITLRVLLAAVLALSGLLLATPAGADETEGRVTASGAAFDSSSASGIIGVSGLEPSGNALLASGLDPLAAGDIASWIKTYGGSINDYFNSVVPIPGGGFVAVGESSSSDGDLPVSGGRQCQGDVSLDTPGRVK